MIARTAAVLCGAGLLLTAVPAVAAVEPFRLGTFERRGEAFLGIVLRDAWAVELAGANASLERHNRMWVTLPMPEDMKELAGRWAIGMRDRVHAIVDQVLPLLDRPADERPVWIHDLEGLHVFPPVRPGLILATALNYPLHGVEMTTGAPAAMSDASALDDQQVSMDHFWERAPGDRRQNPYLFMKPGSIAIGHGEPILMKPEREMVDWECELAVVIGRPASDVEAEDAGAHIFGYTMMNDVGDREGRGGRPLRLRLAGVEVHRDVRAARSLHHPPRSSWRTPTTWTSVSPCQGRSCRTPTPASWSTGSRNSSSSPPTT